MIDKASAAELDTARAASAAVDAERATVEQDARVLTRAIKRLEADLRKIDAEDRARRAAQVLPAADAAVQVFGRALLAAAEAWRAAKPARDKVDQLRSEYEGLAQLEIQSRTGPGRGDIGFPVFPCPPSRLGLIETWRDVFGSDGVNPTRVARWLEYLDDEGLTLEVSR